MKTAPDAPVPCQGCTACCEGDAMTRADAAMAFALDYLVQQACLGWATNVLLATGLSVRPRVQRGAVSSHELLALAYSNVALTMAREARHLRRGVH